MKLELDIPNEMYDKIVEIAKKNYRTPELQILYFIDKGMNAKSSSPLIYAPGVRSVPGVPNSITTIPTRENPDGRPKVTCDTTTYHKNKK